MKHFTIISDTLVEMGPQSGHYQAKFQCIIEGCNGECATPVPIFHKDGKGVSTSNLIGHIRRYAKQCSAHKLALAEVEAASYNCVECDGETILVHNFSESFPCAVCPHLLLRHAPAVATVASDRTHHITGSEPLTAATHADSRRKRHGPVDRAPR